MIWKRLIAICFSLFLLSNGIAISQDQTQTQSQPATSGDDCSLISHEKAEELLEKKLVTPKLKKTPGAKSGCDYHFADDSMGFVNFNIYVPLTTADATLTQMVAGVTEQYDDKSTEIEGLGVRAVYVGEEGRFSSLFVSTGKQVIHVLFWKVSPEKAENFAKELVAVLK